MRYENRKRLRDSLRGKVIKDVLFSDAHGLVIDLLFEDNTTMTLCTYDATGKPHAPDDFYVGLNKEEL